MRVVMVAKPNQDYSRGAETFLSDFSRQAGRAIEEMDPETREGEMFCRTYDIVEYPTIIALSNDGQVQNTWRGTTFPTISEVSYYVAQD